VFTQWGQAILAFNCGFQQINSVIIVKYKRGRAQFARDSKGMTFVIRVGDGLSPKFHGYRSRKTLPPEGEERRRPHCRPTESVWRLPYSAGTLASSCRTGLGMRSHSAEMTADTRAKPASA
jgi:hypothetical protein